MVEDERLLHDWVVATLGKRLSREYGEVRVNGGEERHGHEGLFPDLILVNHGLTLAVLEVETEGTVGQEQAGRWRALVETGTRLILMVPRTAASRVTSLLWDQGLADRVTIGTYEVSIRMP